MIIIMILCIIARFKENASGVTQSKDSSLLKGIYLGIQSMIMIVIV